MNLDGSPGHLLKSGMAMTKTVELAENVHIGAEINWAEFHFAKFAFDLIAMIQGTYQPNRLSSFYGLGSSFLELKTSSPAASASGSPATLAALCAPRLTLAASPQPLWRSPTACRFSVHQYNLRSLEKLRCNQCAEKKVRSFAALGAEIPFENRSAQNCRAKYLRSLIGSSNHPRESPANEMTARSSRVLRFDDFRVSNMRAPMLALVSNLGPSASWRGRLCPFNCMPRC